MAVMTAKERKELYAKWDKVTLDDIMVHMSRNGETL